MLESQLFCPLQDKILNLGFHFAVLNLRLNLKKRTKGGTIISPLNRLCACHACSYPPVFLIFVLMCVRTWCLFCIAVTIVLMDAFTWVTTWQLAMQRRREHCNGYATYLACATFFEKATYATFFVKVAKRKFNAHRFFCRRIVLQLSKKNIASCVKLTTVMQ